jgi:hypothetical protein
MQPVHFDGVTAIYKAPPDWNEATHGPCVDLPVQRTADFAISRWQPSFSDLQILNNGGSVEIAIAGGQPAIAVGVV